MGPCYALNKSLLMEHQQTPLNPNHPLTDVQKIVAEVLAGQLENCWWYRIQCCGCDDAAKKLAIATDTVRDMIKRGVLPASKIGNDWKIRLVDIDALLKKNATVVPMATVYKPRRKRVS